MFSFRVKKDYWNMSAISYSANFGAITYPSLSEINLKTLEISNKNRAAILLNLIGNLVPLRKLSLP